MKLHLFKDLLEETAKQLFMIVDFMFVLNNKFHYDLMLLKLCIV